MAKARPGDVFLAGLVAGLHLCINDAAIQGDDFQPEQWDGLGKLLENDIVRFEVERLDPQCPLLREMDSLMERYHDVVWPRWREDAEERRAERSRRELVECPLFGGLEEAVA